MIFLSLAASYGLSAAAFFLRRLPRPLRWPAFLLLSALLLASPILVGHPLVRLVAAAFAAIFWMKAWEAFRLDPGARPLRFAAYAAHLLNFGRLSMASCGRPRTARPTGERRRDFAVWSAAFLASTALLVAVFALDWRGLPFLAEHGAKSIAFLLAVLAAWDLHSALWRLAGVGAFHTSPDVLLSSTPAEFWRRWNRPVEGWFLANVHEPVLERAVPISAALAAFAVSGILHESIIDMAAGRLTGGPMAFFLLQGCATAASRRLRPKGPGAVLGAAATWLFLVLSSVLLFAPLDGAVEFYVNDIPAWLRLPS
jgi:hypothetical protein